jgi:hypothetical protein
MTNLLQNVPIIPEDGCTSPNKFVISTGAKRSGEICGFF